MFLAKLHSFRPRALGAALSLVALATTAFVEAASSGSEGASPAGHTQERRVVLRAPGSTMVKLIGGHFRMGSTIPEVAAAQAICRLEGRGQECGSSEFGDEMVAHEVMLSDFWLDRTEVSNGAYQRCVDVGGCAPPTYAAEEAWRADPDRPVTLVSWYDAARYCAFRGARLPTEAEWERAARGWSGRLYPWGNVYNRKVCNHGRFALDELDDGDGYAELAPVDAYPEGRTPEGIANLAGNVEEWVADWYAAGYPEADTVDPQGPAMGDYRVVRGGSYVRGRAWMRGAQRGKDAASSRSPYRGFRCAKSDRPPPLPDDLPDRATP
ncbi:MAG: SUMF1/EgtB/PvdO family nonheme iron enzyme [Polyangiaceae bacterium]